jgi:hypothetical protein
MFLPGFDAPSTTGGADYAASRMIDSYGRAVSYLRLSVTDRCDCRCIYCMPERMSFLPKRDLLSLEGTGPAVLCLRHARRAQDPADRRRTARAARSDGADPIAFATSCERLARRADADHQRSFRASRRISSPVA